MGDVGEVQTVVEDGVSDVGLKAILDAAVGDGGITGRSGNTINVVYACMCMCNMNIMG